MSSAATLTVKGSRGLSNTGAINIEGSASDQATLNVVNAAAGFGTKGVETGAVALKRRGRGTARSAGEGASGLRQQLTL